MAVLRDIAKNLGIIPRLLANRDEKQSNELARLMGENEALRSQMEGAQGGTPTGMKKGGKVKKMAFGGLSGGMKAQPAPANMPAATPFRNVGASIAAAMRRNAANKAAMPASTTPRPGPFPGGKTASQMLAELKAQRGQTLKKGGAVKSSASKRADGVATKGKTRGKMI